MHRTLALLQGLLLLAFVLTRAVVPAGFMPSGQGALGFDWCPSQSAAVVEFLKRSALGNPHNHHSQHSDQHHVNAHHSNNNSAEQISAYCDFAWLSALLIAPELALVLLAFALLLLPRFKLGIDLPHRFHRPPARAPPA